ncbi:hypothetical protein Q765_19135 [Flavobacterium rivuli WB 3.3-2 = DSM 21788]|uniref:Fibronectin type-III domain-containing protein n=2 Tax=Flavobacterium rivuli TaxID=498301 RepID=A0A0A2M079_9FLAO|nr:hypothetical protein Q765_19135 [Flavobacterium rivuli WB 3.3-2 = DSM 21788]
MKFKIAFAGGTNGVYQLVLGDGGAYSDNSQIFPSSTQIFAGIKWTLGSSNAITYNVINGSAYGTTGITNATSLFTQNTSTIYNVEIYMNNSNSSTTTTYARGSESFTLANATWDLWVNGTRVGAGLSKGSQSANSNIDSFMYFHQDSSSTPGTIYIDDIEYSNILGSSVTTTAATALTATSATLNGTINPNNTGAVNAKFQYGTATGVYGTAVDATTPTIANGTTATSISLPITSLAVNTQYFFRAVGTQGTPVTTTNGGEQNFYTLANAPGAPTIGNATLTSLNVTIAPNSNPANTTYVIRVVNGGTTQYVQSNGTLGASEPATPSTSTSVNVTGLANATTYTFSVKAKNGAGTDTAYSTTTDGTTLANTSPTITTGGTIAALSTTYGTATATPGQFTVSSLNLTNDIAVTAPAGYEFSLSAGGAGTYTPSVTVPQNTTNTIVYIRLAATAPAATYSGTGNVVTLTSGSTTITKAITNSTVAQKALTISGLTSIGTKVYDGTATAVVTGTPVLSATANGDAITLGGTPVYVFTGNNANVGTAKPVTASGFTLSGTNAANYSLTQPTGLTSSVTAKPVTIDNAAAQNKPYDALQTAVVSGTVNGAISQDDVTVSTTGQFTQASVGDNITVNGFTLTGAQAGNYILTQQPTVVANITKGINNLASAAINLGLNVSYNLPGTTITSISDAAYTYSLTASSAVTLSQNTLTTSATTVGSATLTITQAETANYLGKTITVPVNVSTITYVDGDYRTTGTGNWVASNATPAIWERYNGSSWVVSNSPPFNTAANIYVANGNILTTSASFANSVNIKVLNGGSFISRHNSTAKSVYIYTGGTFTFQDNALTISTNFDIEDGGNFIFDYDANPGAGLNIWNGVENFRPNSNFIIRSHKTGADQYFLPIADTRITGQLYNGVTSYFGNLIIESEVRLTLNNFNNKTLTHGNLEIKPSVNSTFIYGSVVWTVGGNLLINQSTGTTTARTINLTAGNNSGAVTLNIKGDIINNSKNTFRLSSGSGTVAVNVDGNITLNDEGKLDLNSVGTSTLNVKGDVSATASAVIYATAATATLNLNGTGNGLTDATTQTIDVASTATNRNQNINFFAKSGSYVKLLNRDFELGTGSKVTVENGSTIDFGFNLTTPLVVKAVTGATNTAFQTATNSTLKVTSENGVNGNAASTGNVQVATTTYHANTNYYFVGSTTLPQVFGNGFSSARNIYIEKSNATDVVSASQNVGSIAELHVNTGVLSAGAFKLGGTTTTLTIPANGKYVTAGTGTKPDAEGVYSLSAASTVEFTGSDATDIRTTPTYGKVLVTGTNVGTDVATSGLKFTTGGAFEVTNGSKFKVAQATGFNGGTATAVTTTGTPAITLGETSTVEYTGTAAQTITAFNTTTGEGTEGYGNLTVKNSGITTLGAYLIYARNDVKLEGTTAALTINTGYTLKVKNQFVTNGNTVLIENNGALLQTNDVVNSGEIDVLKNGNHLYRYDYTLWSSPVFGSQKLNQFSPSTVSTRFYDYGVVNNTGYYLNIPNGDVTFTRAKGYLIRMPDVEPQIPGYYTIETPFTFVGNFEGTPNNGNIAIAANTAASRYTAVGNPYPSPISVVDFFTTNSEVINAGSGIYFWRKKNGANTSSYATLTLAGYTNAGYHANPAPGNNSADQAQFFTGNQDGWLISQGQGFFVRTKENLSGTPQITFNNGMRRAAPTSGTQAFFRTAQSTTSRLWLNITNANDEYSQSAIAYIDGTTTGLDYGYDGRQFSDANGISLYSLAEDTKLSIQARPLFENSDVVPMGYVADVAGQLTIALDHTDGVFSNGQDVYLRDNVLGLIHNVTEGAYTFATEAGTFNERFDVVYTADALGTTNPVLNANSVIIYKDGNSLNINAGNSIINGVTVFDIRGRQLQSKTGVNAAQTVLTGLDVAQQVLIIEVTTDHGKVSKKIVY